MTNIETVASQIADHLLEVAEMDADEGRLGMFFVLTGRNGYQIAAWLEKIMLARPDLCEALVSASPDDRGELFDTVKNKLADRVARYG